MAFIGTDTAILICDSAEPISYKAHRHGVRQPDGRLIGWDGWCWWWEDCMPIVLKIGCGDVWPSKHHPIQMRCHP